MIAAQPLSGRRRAVPIFALALVLATALPCGAADPGAVPDALRKELKLDPFYQRHVDAGGLPVVGSAKVSDHALAEAAWVVTRMLDGRDDIIKAMRANRVRVAVMAATEASGGASLLTVKATAEELMAG